MAFGQYILEMEVRVTEDLPTTFDCRCSSKTLEPWPCPSGQTTIDILQLKMYCSDKINNMEQYGMVKNNWNLTWK